MDDLQYLKLSIEEGGKTDLIVLNLVINGWPSIPLPKGWMSYLC